MKFTIGSKFFIPNIVTRVFIIDSPYLLFILNFINNNSIFGLIFRHFFFAYQFFFRRNIRSLHVFLKEFIPVEIFKPRIRLKRVISATKSNFRYSAQKLIH